MNHQPLFGHSGIHGAAPACWYGKYALSAAVGDWAKAPVGSEYIYKPNESSFTRYRKIADNGLASDWIVENGMIVQRVSFSDFTDGGAAVGTLVLDDAIPAGVTVKRTYVRDLVGFTGNVSATLTVGDGTDVDRYNTGTPSVFTTAANLAMGAVSGTAYHASAIATVTLTVTSSSDFTAVVAGALTVIIMYE